MHRTIARIRSVIPALVATALIVASPASAEAQGNAPWDRVDPAQELLDGATPRAESIQIDLPSVTQDGSSVPLSIEVDHPMRSDDYIEALYVFATRNPSPEVVEYHFTPLAGKARISTRVRLNESQTVFALARTSRGAWLAGTREIRVTVSGCIAQGNAEKGPDFMQTRVRAASRARPGEPLDVRTLINHPMETGLREDSNGNAIPERIVHSFRAEINGETVLTARFHRAVSANPYLLFYIAPGQSGPLHLTWEEDTGETATATAEIPAA